MQFGARGPSVGLEEGRVGPQVSEGLVGHQLLLLVPLHVGHDTTPDGGNDGGLVDVVFLGQVRDAHADFFMKNEKRLFSNTHEFLPRTTL